MQQRKITVSHFALHDFSFGQPETSIKVSILQDKNSQRKAEDESRSQYLMQYIRFFFGRPLTVMSAFLAVILTRPIVRLKYSYTQFGNAAKRQKFKIK